ncbi:MAG: hypothetical protein R3F21_09090 [Myxococcota bacterium]
MLGSGTLQRLTLTLMVMVMIALGSISCSQAEQGEAVDPSGGEASVAAVEHDSESPAPGKPGGMINAENVFEHERAWPDIVALVEPWTPTGAETPLKAGYRGALIRVEPDGRVRIAFGRHGNQLIPLEFTDLITRANEVESGSRHKIAPNFLLHFGTQFLHPESEALAPLPTPELAKSTRFLCVFAAPARPEFEGLVERLKPLGEIPDLQLLFFPLDMPQGSAERVKASLTTLAWPVPFAYPQAAEVHAQKLVGKVPEAATALLITDEGRLLLEVALDQSDAFERLQAAAGQAATGME